MTCQLIVKPRWAAFCLALAIGSAKKSMAVTCRPRSAKNRAFSPVPQPASRMEPVIWWATATNFG